MLSQLSTRFLNLLLLVGFTFSPLVQGKSGVDFVIPEVQLIESPGGIFDREQSIVIRAVDNTGVTKVTLFFRLDGTQPFSEKSLVNTGKQNLFRGQIPLPKKFAGRVQYFVTAQDAAGNVEYYGQAGDPISLLIASDSKLANKLGAGGEPTNLSSGTEVAIPFYKKKRVLYTVLGVLAVGVLAAASDGGSSGNASSSCDAAGCNLTITTPTIAQ